MRHRHGLRKLNRVKCHNLVYFPRLGITESRVSQLHTQAITRLRTILSGYVQDGMPAM